MAHPTEAYAVSTRVALIVFIPLGSPGRQVLLVVLVGRAQPFPLLRGGIKAQRCGARGRRSAPYALEAADIGAELAVIVILQPAQAGLAVPAVLVVELVAEAVGHAAAHPPVPGDPLVPAGDEHELRIHRQGPVPLLLKVGPSEGGVRAGVKAPGGVGAAEYVVSVHHAHLPLLGAPGVGVLGHAHGDLLRRAVGICVHTLGIHRQPAPHVLPGLPQIIGRLAGPEGKKVQYLLLHGVVWIQGVRVAHDQRPALPVKPYVPEQADPVYLFIQLPQLPPVFLRVGRIVGVVKGQQKRHAGHADPVLLRLFKGPAQRHIALLPGVHAVGVVEYHRVHPGVCQQLRLAAQHPGVVGVVIPVHRLVPVAAAQAVPTAHALPGGMVVVVLGLGVPVHHVLHVEGPRAPIRRLPGHVHRVMGRIVPVVPGPEKHAHEPFPGPAHLPVFRQDAAQPVHRAPGIRPHVLHMRTPFSWSIRHARMPNIFSFRSR